MVRRNVRSLGAILAIGLAAGGCDPCAGTFACGSGERVSYTGHVVERATGRSVSGATVSFIRTGGAALDRDTVTATSGSDGFFVLATPATSAGTVQGTLRVNPPGRPGYDVPGIELRTTHTAGDGGDLGRIVVDPYIMLIGQIQNRAKGSSAGAFATVAFRRSGGIGAEPSLIVTAADQFGRFFLAPTADAPGTLIGDLAITPPGDRTYLSQISIDTRYRDEAVHDVRVFNIGSALLWVGEIYRRGSNAHVAGIPVDFTRTGGVLADPNSFTSTTNEIGLFAIQPVPRADGEVIGDITVHPPGGLAPFTVKNISIHTATDDSVRLAGRWGYGAQAYGLIELRYRTTNAPVDPGTTVIFRRTGGVRVVPDTFVDVVKQLGFAGVQLAADTPGDVIGNFEVRMPPQYGTEIVTGRHVGAFEDDTQHFLGTVLVGRWFPQIAQIVDSATHAAIPGARVVVTRVDGVDFKPNPYTVTPDPANGIFALRPQPQTDGDAVVNVTFELPAPYTTFTVQGIHLRTSSDDNLQFIGTWFAAKR